MATAAWKKGGADLYRRRWAIEQLFRTLKTQGFDVEALRIRRGRSADKLTMAASSPPSPSSSSSMPATARPAKVP